MDGEFDLAEGRIGVEGVALGVIFAGGSAADSGFKRRHLPVIEFQSCSGEMLRTLRRAGRWHSPRRAPTQTGIDKEAARGIAADDANIRKRRNDHAGYNSLAGVIVERS